MQPATFAAGPRRRFEDLPVPVAAWVAEQLGDAVVDVRNVAGGFSPGVAAVVTAADGRGLFVKAVGSELNVDSISFYRRELEAAARLPSVPGLVRPIAGAELDAVGETYVVLVFPALAGAPPRHPWRADELDRVLSAQYAISRQLTPSPWPASDGDRRLPDFFRWWDQIVADRSDPWSDRPWVRRHAVALVAAEGQLRKELPGNTLSHADLRADNLVLTADRVCFVDWAHAQNAAPWVDAALLLGDVIASGADVADGGEVDVSATMASAPALHGVGPGPVWRLLVGLAGALHALSRRTDPPGLPTIRGWQAQTAGTLLGWCQRRAPDGMAQGP